MNTDKWFQLMLPSARKRVYKEIQIVVSDHNERNVLYSSSTFTQGIVAGYIALNKEMNDLVMKLSELKLSKKDWEAINKRSEALINEEYINIINYFSERNFHIENYMNESTEGLIDIHRKESLGLLKLAIEVQKQIASSRFWRTVWGLVSIILGALAASLIGGYVSKFIY